MLAILAGAAPPGREEALRALRTLHASPQLAAGHGAERGARRGADYVRDETRAAMHMVERAAAAAGGAAALRAWVAELCASDTGAERPADPPLPDPFFGVIDDDAFRNMAALRECAHCGSVCPEPVVPRSCRSTYKKVQ